MKITGIICEYNPLHAGHKKQLDFVRQSRGDESGIVCLMSGNFVQRGAPAIVDKSLRARARRDLSTMAGAPRCTKFPLMRQTMPLSSPRDCRTKSSCFLCPA